MAAAELSAVERARQRVLRKTFAWAYGAVWASTLAAALVLELLGNSAQALARRLLGARLKVAGNPPPQIGHVLALSAHNLPIVAWPLLLTILGAQRSRVSRLAANVLLATTVLANTVPVGAALAAYGAPLLAFIPQLPLEWAGLALGAVGWLAQRERALSTRAVLALLGSLCALVLAAAIVETVVAPHR
ncbi:MAG TPA: hypothetical protein VF706_04240 [Solirubrobacteraceae bacterium]